MATLFAFQTEMMLNDVSKIEAILTRSEEHFHNIENSFALSYCADIKRRLLDAALTDVSVEPCDATTRLIARMDQQVEAAMRVTGGVR